jgi:hypothetical protein
LQQVEGEKMLFTIYQGGIKWIAENPKP